MFIKFCSSQTEKSLSRKIECRDKIKTSIRSGLADPDSMRSVNTALEFRLWCARIGGIPRAARVGCVLAAAKVGRSSLARPFQRIFRYRRQWGFEASFFGQAHAIAVIRARARARAQHTPRSSNTRVSFSLTAKNIVISRGHVRASTRREISVILGAVVSTGESINPYLRAYISNSRALLIAFARQYIPRGIYPTSRRPASACAAAPDCSR